MYENYESEENQKQEKRHLTGETKKQLLGVLGGPRALIVMVLSIIAFLVSTYFAIMIAVMDTTITYGNNQTFEIPGIDLAMFLVIAISALISLFFIYVYSNAREKKAEKTGKAFKVAATVAKVLMWFIIIGGILMFIGSIGVLMFEPVIGLILMIVTGVLIGLGILIYRIIINFLSQVHDNLISVFVLSKANPVKMIVLYWISLVLSAISLMTGSSVSNPPNNLYVLPQNFIDTVNQMSLFGGIIGILSVIATLVFLYQFKNEYYNRSI